jgi:hypothetical protein
MIFEFRAMGAEDVYQSTKGNEGCSTKTKGHVLPPRQIREQA